VEDIPDEINSTDSLRKCFLSSVGDNCICTGTKFSNTLSDSEGRIPMKFVGVIGLFIPHVKGFDMFIISILKTLMRKIHARTAVVTSDCSKKVFAP
jgi:hypothetical protein